MKQIGFMVIAAVAACGGDGNKASPDAEVDAALPPGTFAPQVTYVTGVFPAGGGSSPTSVAIGDLNGDGKPDLATANNGNFNDAVLLNSGTGTFGTAVEYSSGNVIAIAIADLNGDGKRDVVDSNFVRLNNGDGSLAASVLHPSVGGWVIATADLNGDGKLDLAGAGGGTSIYVALGNGDGTFGTAVGYPVQRSAMSVVIGDFNGDGYPDLAAGNEGDTGAYGNTVSVLLNIGNGTFGGQVEYSTLNAPAAVATGDLNGDGKLDLAVSSYNERNVSILMGNGDGTFGTHVTYPTQGMFCLGVAIADLNGDGRADVAVTNGSYHNLGILYNNGDGTFATEQTFQTGIEPHALAIGDLNGDQRPDIVVANRASDTVGVFLWKP